MIKVDIVNEVSRLADITKVKAEVAVDAVFEAMRASMMRGERIELRGLRRVPGQAPQARHRPQPADRQGSQDSPRAGRSASSRARNCRTSAASRVSDDDHHPTRPTGLRRPRGLTRRIRTRGPRACRRRGRDSSIATRSPRAVPGDVPHDDVLPVALRARRSSGALVHRRAGRDLRLADISSQGLWYSVPLLTILGAPRVRPLLRTAATTTSTRRCPTSCRRRSCSPARSAP